MASFDPSKNRGAGRGYIDQPGKYVLVLTKLTARDESRKGTKFVRFAARCIAGPNAGKTMAITFYLSQAALVMLGAACEAMGVDAVFDYDDDRSLTDALLFRPFKASVACEHNAGQTYAKVGQWLSYSELTTGEEAAVAKWAAENEARAAQSTADGLPPDDEFGDDFAAHRSRSGAGADDDIPFAPWYLP